MTGRLVWVPESGTYAVTASARVIRAELGSPLEVITPTAADIDALVKQAAHVAAEELKADLDVLVTDDEAATALKAALRVWLGVT